MEFFDAIGLGIALAVDASLVAFSCGIFARRHSWHCPFRLALVAGIFQGVMPTLGFFCAESIFQFIESWAHWIAFCVFVLLGILFIKNAWQPAKSDGNEHCGTCKNCAIETWRGVFAVGVATSIDALAVGAGIACANATGTLAEKIFVPASIIAGTTFICVLLAFFASRIFRSLPAKFLGTLAGLIMIVLGIRAVI